MGHCKDCKWWNSPEIMNSIFHDKPAYGQCELTTSGSNQPFWPESLAVASSVSGYSGALNTSPEFGCVQWEAQDANVS
jgi:hypothetical protein